MNKEYRVIRNGSKEYEIINKDNWEHYSYNCKDSMFCKVEGNTILENHKVSRNAELIYDIKKQQYRFKANVCELYYNKKALN